MSKRTVTENDVWHGNEPIHPELSVSIETPEPVPGTAVITMSREYAQRLYKNLSQARQVGDTSILWRVLGVALGEKV